MQDGHPIAHESHKLSDVEKWWLTHEKKMLAVMYCLQVCEHYLKVAIPFKIKTDNSSVIYHQMHKQLSSKQARWLDYLVEFKYELEYNSGKINVTADILSHKSVIAPMYTTEGLLLKRINKRLQHDDWVQVLMELADEEKMKRY